MLLCRVCPWIRMIRRVVLPIRNYRRLKLFYQTIKIFQRMRKFIFYTAIISSLSVGIYGCSFSEAADTSPNSSGEKALPAAPPLAEVLQDQPEFFIQVPGELFPYEEVDIYPKARGFVKKIYVD